MFSKASTILVAIVVTSLLIAEGGAFSVHPSGSGEWQPPSPDARQQQGYEFEYQQEQYQQDQQYEYNRQEQYQLERQNEYQPFRPADTVHSYEAPPSPPVDENNPYAILGFDVLAPPKDFALIHRAYRSLARESHPDAAAGPDAAPGEREAAALRFSRISEAYEELKSRRDDEEFECVIMGGNFSRGKRDRRVRYKTSAKIRQNDPDRVNYDRILELRERKSLRARNWSDPGEYQYDGGRHNGDFGPPRRW